ncbi:hypothetical protein D3C72_1674190 [compost metagenome]
MPDGAVAGGANLVDRKRRVDGLQFLEAGHVGRLARQPIQQRRQAGTDAIDIEGGDLESGHRLSLCEAGNTIGKFQQDSASFASVACFPFIRLFEEICAAGYEGGLPDGSTMTEPGPWPTLTRAYAYVVNPGSNTVSQAG